MGLDKSGVDQLSAEDEDFAELKSATEAWGLSGTRARSATDHQERGRSVKRESADRYDRNSFTSASDHLSDLTKAQTALLSSKTTLTRSRSSSSSRQKYQPSSLPVDSYENPRPSSHPVRRSSSEHRIDRERPTTYHGGASLGRSTHGISSSLTSSSLHTSSASRDVLHTVSPQDLTAHSGTRPIIGDPKGPHTIHGGQSVIRRPLPVANTRMTVTSSWKKMQAAWPQN
jgi:hypothetical protein